MMERKKRLIKAIILVLCMAMTLSLLAACKKSKKSPKKESPKDKTTVEAPISDSPSSEIEEPFEDPGDDWQEPEDLEETEELDTYTCKFLNNTAPVMTNYRGSSSVLYEMYTYMPYINKANSFTEREAQEQFNRMQEIGISLVRTDYNTYMNYDSKSGSYNFESAYMQAYYKEGLEMKKRGIDIAILPGWSHHALVDNTSSIASQPLYVSPEIYDANGRQLIGDNLYDSYNEGDKFDANGALLTKDAWKKAMNTAYTETMSRWKSWMRESILNLRAHGLTNIDTIIMFTEPCKVGFNPDKRLYHYETYVEACRVMDGLLKEMGLRDQFVLVGPNIANDGSGTAGYRNGGVDYKFKTNIEIHSTYSEGLAYMLENAMDYLDVFSTHTYFRSKDATSDTYYYSADMYVSDWMKTVKDYTGDKEFWVDEWNTGVSGSSYLYDNSPWLGTQLAAVVINMQEYGVSNNILWSLYNQQWPNHTGTGGEFVDGVQMCGLAYSLQLSTIPNTQYYGYTLLSRFLNHKNIVYQSAYDKDGVYFSMVGNANGETTILAVNCNGDDVKVEMDLEKSLGGITLYRHVYNPNTWKANAVTQVIPADRAYRPVQNRLVDILKAGEVAVYTTDKLAN